MAKIAQVNQDMITPLARPVDLLITSLHEHNLLGTYCLAYFKTTLMLADMLSKPLYVDILLDKVLLDVGFIFYPPTTSENFRILQLDVYPIGTVYSSNTHHTISSNSKDVSPLSKPQVSHPSPSSQNNNKILLCLEMIHHPRILVLTTVRAN